MPPKGWKKYADGFKPATSQGTPAQARQTFSIEELQMPRSAVLKLAKTSTTGALPKDGVTALQRSATVFINYVCNQANKECQKSGRKMLAPQDIEAALEKLGFGGFIGQVKLETQKFVDDKAAKKKS